MTIARNLLTGMLVAALPAAATAQDADGTDPIALVRKCRGIADAAQRLACYDASSRTLDDLVGRRQIVVVTKAEVARTRRSLFGFPIPDKGVLAGDDGPAETRIDFIIS